MCKKMVFVFYKDTWTLVVFPGVPFKTEQA